MRSNSSWSSELAWIGVALAAGLVLPLWIGLADHPDVSVDARPLRIHAGALRSAAPPGQMFRCGGQGLEAIDVALVSLIPESSEVELVLREESADGAVLRRVSVRPGELAEPEFVSFPFAPIEDSGNRWYHFQLLPGENSSAANYSPWIRFHGQTGRDDPWGAEVLETRAAQGYFQSPLGDLRALAVGCEHLSTEAGAIRFELWDLDDGGRTRRDLELPAPTLVDQGYAIFSFAPIAGSKGHNYGYRIQSSGPARFNGRFGQPTLKTLHGQVGVVPGLRGSTVGARVLLDRDLTFRAWSSYGRLRGLQLAWERAGWRFWAAAACWILAVLALARVLFGAHFAPAAPSVSKRETA